MKICPSCYNEMPTEILTSYPPQSPKHDCKPKVTKCCGDKAIIRHEYYKFDPENDEHYLFSIDRKYHYECKKCEQACDLTYEK